VVPITQQPPEDGVAQGLELQRADAIPGARLPALIPLEAGRINIVVGHLDHYAGWHLINKGHAAAQRF
jgi:hypothetical protein